MRRDLEAVLFATDQPLSLPRLAAVFPDFDRKAIRTAIEELREEYDRESRAFTIVEFGGGYSIATRPEHAAVVRRLYKGRGKVRLSRAALECLAIVAYKQPATRLDIEEIRGVSVSGVLGTLLERDLVAIVGRAQGLGHPLLYGTTKNFLDYLGLRGVEELPQLSELEDLLARKEELKQLAARYGAELPDEELEQFVRRETGEPNEAAELGEPRESTEPTGLVDADELLETGEAVDVDVADKQDDEDGLKAPVEEPVAAAAAHAASPDAG